MAKKVAGNDDMETLSFSVPKKWNRALDYLAKVKSDEMGGKPVSRSEIVREFLLPKLQPLFEIVDKFPVE